MHETVIKLLDEGKAIMATDRLKVFTDWPDDLIATNSAPHPAPVNKTVAWNPLENN